MTRLTPRERQLADTGPFRFPRAHEDFSDEELRRRDDDYYLLIGVRAALA